MKIREREREEEKESARVRGRGREIRETATTEGRCVRVVSADTRGKTACSGEGGRGS